MRKKITGIMIIFALLILVFHSPTQSALADDYQELKLGSSITANITEDNRENTYKIVVTQTGRINIKICTYIYSDAKMKLLDDKGNTIFDEALPDCNGNLFGEEFSKGILLNAGTYYVKLSDYVQVGKYNIIADFSPANRNEVEPNNDKDNAQLLGLNNEAMYGCSAWNDNNDVYKFVLTKYGKVHISVLSQLSNLTFSLQSETSYITSKQVIPESYCSQTISIDLSPGTYYVTVQNGGQDTGYYTLRAQYEEVENSNIEPNNDISHAQPFALNEKHIKGYLTYGNNKNIYKLSIPNISSISISCVTYVDCGELTLELSDSNGNKIWSGNVESAASGGAKQILTSVSIPKAGVYYLSIGHYNEDINYGTFAIRVATFSKESFDSNGGSQVPSKIIEYNKKAYKPDNPTKLGYRFEGWYKESALVNKYDFASPVTSNITLYAKWTSLTPLAPRIHPIVKGAMYVNVSWDGVLNKSKYEVYRATSPNGIYVKVGETSDSFFCDKNVAIGVTYYYKVRAFNAISTSTKLYGQFSAGASGSSTPCSVYSVVVNPNSYKSLVLRWNQATGASGYEIYRSTSLNGKYIKIGETKATKYNGYVDNGLITGTTYYYKVVSFTTVGKNRVRGNDSYVNSRKPELNTPSVFPVWPMATSISYKVQWSTVDGADGYELYCSTSYNGAYSKFIETKNDGYKVSWSPKKIYYYKVRAFKKVGNKRVYSNFSSIVYRTN